MKIGKGIIEKYMELCPLSSSKCENFQEIEYKIKRSVELGKVMSGTGDKLIVGYYNNRFVTYGGKIIGMYKSDECIYVREELKQKHFNEHFKVLV